MSNLDLKKLEKYQAFPGPVVMVIMDGIGIGKGDESDGLHVAKTPTLDGLFQEPLYTELQAHGEAVGLPSDDDMGNSEVGHNALGAGRVFSQGARLVNEAIKSGHIFNGSAWNTIIDRAKEGGTVHFIGLTSDGNVHSHIDHLYAMVDRCVEDGVERVRVHTLLDGRDVGEKSALEYIEPLEEHLAGIREKGLDYRIASGGGRMITTMDRYNADWSVVERGWKAHVLGESRQFESASQAIKTYYDEDPKITDQYMDSFVVAEDGKPVGTIEDGDNVVFFNFRGDRAIEISRAFEENELTEFDRKRKPDVFYAGMMEYDGDAHIPRNFLVEPPCIDHTVGEYMCAAKIHSFAISETQKYGHVTYFWNGNNSGYINDEYEDYVEIPSDKVPFDQRPRMQADKITDQVVEAIQSGQYEFVRLNYANGDMVGHTGVRDAIIEAVETVDECLGRLAPVVEAAKGVLVVTADHGNADCMFTEKNGKREPMVAHTLNPVPFIVKDFSGANKFEMAGVEHPGLSNIAATVLTLLGYEKPAEYDESLVKLAE